MSERDTRREAVARQVGFELLSVFKGATTEAIDDAVERMLTLFEHPATQRLLRP